MRIATEKTPREHLRQLYCKVLREKQGDSEVSGIVKYYTKVHAHRQYQLTVCMYKQAKYQRQDFMDKKAMEDRWNKIDEECHKSITEYKAITDVVDGVECHVFIDLIIRLTLMRAQAS